MQIALGNLLLLGIIPEESAQNFRLVPTSDVQEAKAIGASDLTQFLRGNKKRTWTFTVQRAHLNAESALYFIHAYEQKFPAQDKLTITTDAGVFIYASAVAALTQATFEGATSTVGYRVTSGGPPVNGTGGTLQVDLATSDGSGVRPY